MYHIDQSLFVLINSTLSNSIFDILMPFITDLHKDPLFTQVFVPFILFIWILRKKAKAIPVMLGLALCIAATDNTNHRILKPIFKRQRPPLVEKTIQLRTDRFAGYSFPSNHAGNNFAAATFLSSCYPALSWYYFAIAIVVSYSRIYVGVHYPFDVIAGALIGLFFGLFFFRILYIILNKAYDKGHRSLF